MAEDFPPPPFYLIPKIPACVLPGHSGFVFRRAICYTHASHVTMGRTSVLMGGRAADVPHGDDIARDGGAR